LYWRRRGKSAGLLQGGWAGQLLLRKSGVAMFRYARHWPLATRRLFASVCMYRPVSGQVTGGSQHLGVAAEENFVTTAHK
jgi:hypothetical protein